MNKVKTISEEMTELSQNLVYRRIFANVIVYIFAY